MLLLRRGSTDVSPLFLPSWSFDRSRILQIIRTRFSIKRVKRGGAWGEAICPIWVVSDQFALLAIW
jgi:hypothetical protein